MAQSNALVASTLVREHVAPGDAELVFRDTDYITFLKGIGRWFPIGGAFPYQWLLNYAGNTSSEIYVEGQAYGPTGQQSYVRCSINPFYARARVGLTGHLRDQQRNGGLYQDADRTELVRGTADLMRSIEGQLLGSTQDRGIASVIDGGDTYAGVAPGTITAHASVETAVGGALSFSVLETMWETLIGNPRNAKPKFVLTRENQINNYLALVGPGAGTSNIARIDITNGATGVIDYGLMKNIPAFNGAEFKLVRDLVNTEMYFVDPGMDQKDYGVCEVRPVQVDDDAKVSDDQTRTISWGGMPICKYRRRQGVLRTLST